MSNKMSDDEVRDEFQIISINVKWSVADILRRKPEWTVEQAEHFIDSAYQEIAAEAREASDRVIDGIIKEMEKNAEEQNH